MIAVVMRSPLQLILKLSFVFRLSFDRLGKKRQRQTINNVIMYVQQYNTIFLATHYDFFLTFYFLTIYNHFIFDGQCSCFIMFAVITSIPAMQEAVFKRYRCVAEIFRELKWGRTSVLPL